MLSEEALFRNLLDRMVLHGRDNIEVHLKLLTFHWRYAVTRTLKVQESSKDSDESEEEDSPSSDAQNNPQTQLGSGLQGSEHYCSFSRYGRNNNVPLYWCADKVLY